MGRAKGCFGASMTFLFLVDSLLVHFENGQRGRWFEALYRVIRSIHVALLSIYSLTTRYRCLIDDYTHCALDRARI